jgi:hypothetical protein
MKRFISARFLLVAGGLISSLVLLGFGTAAIAIGYQGRQDVRDTLAEEKITGPQDSAIPGEFVDTGSEARAMADVMRAHTMKSTNGLTYAEMGRFKTPDGDPKGTSDANAALKDANGKPVPNTARDLWVTETALATALNTAYFAEQVGTFAIVVGTALVLSGIGFGVLTVGALRRTVPVAAPEKKLVARGVVVPSGAK